MSAIWVLDELTAHPESLSALPGLAENGVIEQIKQTVSMAGSGRRLDWRPTHHWILFQERTALGMKNHPPHGTGKRGYR